MSAMKNVDWNTMTRDDWMAWPPPGMDPADHR
jgi:hypothetical protein